MKNTNILLKFTLTRDTAECQAALTKIGKQTSAIVNEYSPMDIPLVIVALEQAAESLRGQFPHSGEVADSLKKLIMTVSYMQRRDNNGI